MLDHEALVLRSLPEAVPHAEVVGVGREESFGWLVLVRLPGEQLGRCWPDLADEERQDAIGQLGRALQRIHAIPEPLRFRHPWVEDPGPDPMTYQPHPNRAPLLLEAARRLPDVDHGLLDAVEGFLGARLDAFASDEGSEVLVHADLHFENLLWDRAGRQLTAVLDFEMSRPAAADLDLNVVLRMCGDPALLVAEDYEDCVHPADFADVPGWLRGVYPELFDDPQLVPRQEAYAAMYDLRALLAYWRPNWGRRWAVDELHDLLAGRSFVQRLLKNP